MLISVISLSAIETKERFKVIYMKLSDKSGKTAICLETKLEKKLNQ